MTGQDKPARKAIRGRLLAAIFAGIAVVLVGLHVSSTAQFSAQCAKRPTISTRPPRRSTSISARSRWSTIDEASLRTFGRWPWPRAQVAKVVDAIARAARRLSGSTFSSQNRRAARTARRATRRWPMRCSIRRACWPCRSIPMPGRSTSTARPGGPWSGSIRTRRPRCRAASRRCRNWRRRPPGSASCARCPGATA
jgi:hypothetical protein